MGLAAELNKCLKKRRAMEQSFNDTEIMERNGFDDLQTKTGWVQQQRRLYEDQAQRMTLTISLVGSALSVCFTWYLTQYRFNAIRGLVSDERKEALTDVKDLLTKRLPNPADPDAALQRGLEKTGIGTLVENLNNLNQQISTSRHESRLAQLRDRIRAEKEKDVVSVARLAELRL